MHLGLTGACAHNISSYLSRVLATVNRAAAWTKHGGADYILSSRRMLALPCSPVLLQSSARASLWQVPERPHAGRSSVASGGAAHDDVLPVPTSRSWTNTVTFDTLQQRRAPRRLLGIRQALYRYGSQNGSRVGSVLVGAPVIGQSSGDAFEGEVSRSAFCLAPPWWAAWSQRTYDLIAMGCPPVFFSTRASQFRAYRLR